MAFSEMTAIVVYKPLKVIYGIPLAMIVSFLVSGMFPSCPALTTSVGVRAGVVAWLRGCVVAGLPSAGGAGLIALPAVGGAEHWH